MAPDNHEQLLADWAGTPLHAKRDFVADGIIDYGRWQCARRKALFLLREAYGGRFDLREYIRSHRWDDGPALKRVALWAFVLQHGTPDAVPDLYEPRPVDPEAIQEALLASAMANVKKSNGTSRSEEKDIARYVRADARLIARQIEIIDPDIIVSGNVWYEALFPGAKRVHDLVLVWKNRWIVDFWHPANQFPDLVNYHAFASVVQSAGILSDARTRPTSRCT